MAECENLKALTCSPQQAPKSLKDPGLKKALTQDPSAKTEPAMKTSMEQAPGKVVTVGITPKAPKTVSSGVGKGSPAKASDPKAAKKVAKGDSTVNPTSDIKKVTTSTASSGGKVLKTLPQNPIVAMTPVFSPKLVSKVTKKTPALDSDPVDEADSHSKRELRKAPTIALAKGNMRCVQCGKERSIALSRSAKFCTQRCTVQWVEANPGKVPCDAQSVDVQEVVDSKATPSTPESSGKTIPRALKNLQIDMAKPGTKLTHSPGSDSSDELDGTPSQQQTQPVIVQQLPSVEAPSSVIHTHIIDSLTTLIAQQQRHITDTAVPVIVPPPMPAGDVASKPQLDTRQTPPKSDGEVKIPAKGAVKRSTMTVHAPAIKKPKISAKSSAQNKSVSFNLSDPPEIAAAAPASGNPVLDRIANYLLPKAEVNKIKIPQGMLILCNYAC
jgi:hypothetical protein